MKAVVLEAEPREKVRKGLFALRQSGKTPAIMYGPGIETQAIQIDSKEAKQKLNGMTGSQLILLKLAGKEFQVLLREIQRDSIRRDIEHIDFYAVPSDRAIRVHVPLVFVGTSVAVRDFGGVFVHLVSELDVECLPKDLVSEIKVDMAPLMKIGDSIAIRDIALPSGIKVLMDPDEGIATVTAQAAEEVAPVASTATLTPEVEVIEKGKKLEEGEETEKEKEKK